MLDSIFMQVLDMSNTASIVILVVLLARLLLKKAPKVFSYALWAVVLCRLLCPFTFEAPVSVMPEIASVSQDYSLSEAPVSVLGAAEAAYHAVGDALNGGLGVQDIRTTEKDEAGRTKYVGSLWWDVWILFGQYVWIAGMGAMLLYSAGSYLKIRKRLLVVVPLRDNIFLADDIKSPFVIGLFRPKIYLPCNLEEKELEYIILHEQHHIKRLDHIIKALAFLALAIHWLNPLVWVAFTLASRDMEMSCDEAVIGKIGGDVRADYSASLLTLATGRRIIAGMPLAFGEGDTKSRIRNLANWRKPAFWVVLISVVACIALAIGLLTNPARNDNSNPAEDGFFLLIGTDGVHSIEISGINTSGGVVNADGSAFSNGEKVWLEPLQGVTDLRGYSITALGKNGEILYALSIPEGATNDEVVNLVGSDDWLLAPTDFESGLSGIAGKTFLYENEGIMGSFSITLYEDGTFTYYEGMASSYIGIGSWEQDSDTITLTDDVDGGYGLVNHFKFDGETLTFVEKGSDNFVYVKVKDGEKFSCTGEAFKQNDGKDGAVQIMPSRKLSLNDVIILSQKGYDLTWSDFDNYAYIETGSGLYIRVYEINEMYELWIGGSWIDEDPMYIYLALADDLDTRIDIRDGGVTDFIGADHSSALLSKAINEAILGHFKSSKPDGLRHCASFASLAQQELCIDSEPASPMQVTVYGMALHEKYGYSGATFHVVESWYNPVKLTFEKAPHGTFQLSDAWFPKYPAESAEQHADAIYEQFSMYSEDLANSVLFELLDKNYLQQVKRDCYDQAVRHGGVDTYSAVEYLFEVIESSPATSSRPADYLDAHPNEYKELMYYGDYTLQYIFSKFHLEGNQTGLRGHLMRIVLDDLSPEAQLRLHAETGQAYFDEWKAGAIRINEQHDMDWIKENQPAIWLFLQWTANNPT